MTVSGSTRRRRRSNDGGITVGDDVRIGPRAQLRTALHPMADHERRRASWKRPAPITTAENAWLGGGVIVRPGVTIGENVVCMLPGLPMSLLLIGLYLVRCIEMLEGDCDGRPR